MELIYLLLTSFGITAIINKGTIFEGLRKWAYHKFKFPWNTFLTCPLCIGFWAGLVVSLIIGSPSGFIFFDACMASGFSWLIMLIEISILSRRSSTCKGCGN